MLFAAPAAAQQTPLTGRMLSTPPAQPALAPVHTDVREPHRDPDAPASNPTPYAAAPYAGSAHPEAFGDTTRALFRLQADPGRPGVTRPVTGEQATASYRRYLRSFEYDIPEAFETNVAEQPNRRR